jgi:DNA-binding transcriptional MocR family regulator
MSDYTSDGRQPGAVVLGYGALTEDEIAEGISELAR